jgi:disulfide bond formation protein DsbB
MSTDTITTFFALLALLANAFVVMTIGGWLLRNHLGAWDAIVELVGPGALWLGATIAIVATAGSLYLSEGAHFIPCRLCWYQRIGMYPLGLILLIAALRKDYRAWIYPFAVSLGALTISIYHVLLERYPSLESGGTCDPDNPCSIVWVRHFGVYTIPFMAGSAFAAIATAMVLAVSWRAKENAHVEG